MSQDLELLPFIRCVTSVDFEPQWDFLFFSGLMTYGFQKMYFA